MSHFPQFHYTGDPDAHFFALAFARGRYVSPNGSLDTPAFLVLCFSASASFAPFSLAIVSLEGNWLAGHRGDDYLRTVEFAILVALQRERVDTRAWTLYPNGSVVESAFPDRSTLDAYWEARRRLCMVLYADRVAAGVEKELGAIRPLFYPDGAIRHTGDGGPDNEEIWETVVALTPDDTGSQDPEGVQGHE